MKLDELKKLKKGTPIVSHTKEHWIEGTFEGLCQVTNLGSFDNFNDVFKAFCSGEGRKETKVRIQDTCGIRHYVSPRSVGLVRKVST